VSAWRTACGANETERADQGSRQVRPQNGHARSWGRRRAPDPQAWPGNSAPPATVRLDDETSQELAELAERHPSRSAAVQAAIHQAWQRLQEEKLQAGYAAALADNPHYPYESAEEAAVLRARRRARQARDSAA
jgi:predicted transcriptional regulator